MFGFDIDDILNGYSKQDEYIARDMLIIELLLEKGILTKEEVKNKFINLEDRIKEVKNAREMDLKNKADEAKAQLEKYKKEGSINDTSKC